MLDHLATLTRDRVRFHDSDVEIDKLAQPTPTQRGGVQSSVQKRHGLRFLRERQLDSGGTTPVTARVSPTDRIRDEIDAMFSADRDLGEVLEDVARLGARLILQAALEAEVTELLGRERYARGERSVVDSTSSSSLTASRWPGY
jgi:hypothetical protein